MDIACIHTIDFNNFKYTSLDKILKCLSKIKNQCVIYNTDEIFTNSSDLASLLRYYFLTSENITSISNSYLHIYFSNIRSYIQFRSECSINEDMTISIASQMLFDLNTGELLDYKFVDLTIAGYLGLPIKIYEISKNKITSLRLLEKSRNSLISSEIHMKYKKFG